MAFYSAILGFLTSLEHATTNFDLSYLARESFASQEIRFERIRWFSLWLSLYRPFLQKELLEKCCDNVWVSSLPCILAFSVRKRRFWAFHKAATRNLWIWGAIALPRALRTTSYAALSALVLLRFVLLTVVRRQESVFRCFCIYQRVMGKVITCCLFTSHLVYSASSSLVSQR